MFRWDNVHKIALISFFSQLYFYGHVTTLYLRFRGLSFFEISSLTGVILATLFLIEVPSGVLADRIGRKKAYLIALAFQLLGEVVYIWAETYWHFFAVSVLAGYNWAFVSGCVEALLYDDLKRRGRTGEMSKAVGLAKACADAGGMLAADQSPNERR